MRVGPGYPGPGSEVNDAHIVIGFVCDHTANFVNTRTAWIFICDITQHCRQDVFILRCVPGFVLPLGFHVRGSYTHTSDGAWTLEGSGGRMQDNEGVNGPATKGFPGSSSLQTPGLD